MIAMTSLRPPAPLSLIDIISIFQPLRSAKREYIRNRSAAKSDASSPPVPARISRMMFLASFGSFGTSRILMSASRASRRASSAFISSCASSRLSGSLTSSSFRGLCPRPPLPGRSRGPLRSPPRSRGSLAALVRLSTRHRRQERHLIFPGALPPAPPARSLAGTPAIPAPLPWLTRCARSAIHPTPAAGTPPHLSGGFAPGTPCTVARGDPCDPRSAPVAHSLRSFGYPPDTGGRNATSSFRGLCPRHPLHGRSRGPLRSPLRSRGSLAAPVRPSPPHRRQEPHLAPLAHASGPPRARLV